MPEGSAEVLLSTLSSYVPIPLARRLRLEPDKSLAGQYRRYPAAVLFADLAKFTPMAEALSRLGSGGIEELTRLLNEYFTGQIAEIDRWGGVVGKFAGDAMTVFFTGRGAAPCAVACAQALLSASGSLAHTVTPAGEFSLQVKLGLAYGQVLEFVVGNEWRREFIFAGEPLDESAQAEHRASPGEIVLGPSILAVLNPDRLELLPLQDGFARLLELKGEVHPHPNLPLPTSLDPQATIQALRPFIPQPAYERILLGAKAFVNEHRQVSVLFVNFEGLNYTLPRSAELLSEYLTRVFEIVERYDGYIRQVEMGDKGSKAIVLFGASVAHEDDQERALLCVLELQALAASQRSTISGNAQLGSTVTAQCIGVTTGRVFVGNVGASHRQEYAAIGDVVNLSARLMQAASPDRVLVDDATYQAASARFNWHFLPKLQVKGKAQPVMVYELVSRQNRRALVLPEERYALPMVGRQAELEQLMSMLKAVKEKQRGQVAGIIGEAGMGKTRLAAEVIQQALDLGFQGLRGNGLSHGATTPYLAWRPVVRGLLGLDERIAPTEQIETIRQYLQAVNPHLPERLPLLGDVLGAAFHDTTLTASMNADLRRQSLFAMLVDLVHHRASQGALLLILEDAHWLDDLSRDLARYLAAAVVSLPVCFLTVYRPPTLESQEALWTSPPSYFQEYRLQPFSPAETRQLIQLKLAGSSLPAALMEKIEKLSAGNPFYIDELINLIRERGVDLADASALEALEVPDSIQTLIITRLDQLAESEKMTVRVASVIGQLFRSQWLFAIYPGQIQQEVLQNSLEAIHAKGIIVIDKPAPELEYLFRHVIMQEVIYGTLSFANRRMLHASVAEYIEKEFSVDLDPWYGILAYHYGRAELAEKEYHYTSLAARRSAGQSAYRQAFELFNRAIALMDEHHFGNAEEVFDLHEARFNTAGVLGENKTVKADAEVLQSLAPGLDVPRQVSALNCMGNALRVSMESPNYAECFRQAVALASEHRYGPGLMEALYFLGAYYFGISDYEQAKGCLRRVIDESTPDEWRYAARARQILGWVVYDEGNFDLCKQYWSEALAMNQGHSSKPAEALVLSNLGSLYATIGFIDKGIEWTGRGLELSIQIGYKTGEEEAYRLLGDHYLGVGQFERSWEYFEQAIAVQQQLGDSPYTLIYSYIRQAEIILETTADLDQAEALCQRAIQAAGDLTDGEVMGWVYRTHGRVQVRRGEYEQAEASLLRSIQERRQIGQLMEVLPTLGDLGDLYLRQGNLPAARLQVDEMLSLLFPSEGQAYDSTYACMACYRILNACGEVQQAQRMLDHAYHTLQTELSKLESEEFRRSYLERLSISREILSAIQ